MGVAFTELNPPYQRAPITKLRRFMGTLAGDKEGQTTDGVRLLSLKAAKLEPEVARMKRTFRHWRGNLSNLVEIGPMLPLRNPFRLESGQSRAETTQRRPRLGQLNAELCRSRASFGQELDELGRIERSSDRVWPGFLHTCGGLWPMCCQSVPSSAACLVESSGGGTGSVGVPATLWCG